MIAIKWEVNPNLISDQLLAHGLLYLLKQLPVGCEVHFLAEIFSYIRCKAGNACNVGIQDAGGLWHVQVEEINHLSVGARCLSALLQATTPFWCTPSVMGPGREQIDVLTEGCRAALSSEAFSPAPSQISLSQATEKLSNEVQLACKTLLPGPHLQPVPSEPWQYAID